MELTDTRRGVADNILKLIGIDGVEELWERLRDPRTIKEETANINLDLPKSTTVERILELFPVPVQTQPKAIVPTQPKAAVSSGPSQVVREKKYEFVDYNTRASGKTAVSFGKEVCGHCKKPGHQESKCFIKHPEQVPFCPHCQIPGHYESTCRFKSRLTTTDSQVDPWARRQKRRTADHENSRIEQLPLGLMLQTVSRDQLDGDSVAVEDARITNLRDVSSYNWIKCSRPTIMIPGKLNSIPEH